MKKNIQKDLVEEYLQGIDTSRQPEAGDFFYTRLKARMEKEKIQKGFTFPFKPAWVIGGLIVLLAVNIFLLGKQTTGKNADAQSEKESFGKTYGLIISTSY